MHVNSFHDQSCFGGKAWGVLTEGPRPLGSFWENKNMLTGTGEPMLPFPAKCELLKSDEFISFDLLEAWSKDTREAKVWLNSGGAETTSLGDWEKVPQ